MFCTKSATLIGRTARIRRSNFWISKRRPVVDWKCSKARDNRRQQDINFSLVADEKQKGNRDQLSECAGVLLFMGGAYIIDDKETASRIARMQGMRMEKSTSHGKFEAISDMANLWIDNR